MFAQHAEPARVEERLREHPSAVPLPVPHRLERAVSTLDDVAGNVANQRRAVALAPAPLRHVAVPEVSGVAGDRPAPREAGQAREQRVRRVLGEPERVLPILQELAAPPPLQERRGEPLLLVEERVEVLGLVVDLPEHRPEAFLRGEVEVQQVDVALPLPGRHTKVPPSDESKIMLEVVIDRIVVEK